MRAEYRFLKTREGVTRYAKVAVASTPSTIWEFSFAETLGEVASIHDHAIRRGLSLAAAEHERRGGSPHRIDVHEVSETIVDSTSDSIECAAAGAAWKSLGGNERDISMTFRDGRWHIEFDVQ